MSTPTITLPKRSIGHDTGHKFPPLRWNTHQPAGLGGLNRTGFAGECLEFPPVAGHFHKERVASWRMDAACGEGVLLGGKRPRRKFSDEFKRDAVEIVRSSGKPVRQVANELGIYDSTLGNWVRQDEVNRGEREGLTSDERERLRELERENARLRMERELLKRLIGVQWGVTDASRSQLGFPA